FVSQFLLTTDTPYNTHVRKGRARTGEDVLYRSHHWGYTEQVLRALFGYDTHDDVVPEIRLGAALDLTTSGCSSPYKDGHWGVTDFWGTWIDGTRADLLLAIDPDVQTDVIAEVRVREAFLGPNGEAVHVDVRLEGEPLARWQFHFRHGDWTY